MQGATPRYARERPLGLKVSVGAARLLRIVMRAGKPGILVADLFDELYRDDPDGGPATGYRCLYVRIHELNRIHLRPIGKEIAANWRGGPRDLTTYALREVPGVVRGSTSKSLHTGARAAVAAGADLPTAGAATLGDTNRH